MEKIELVTGNKSCVRSFYEPEFIQKARKDLGMKEEIVGNYEQLFRLLGHPVRLRIAYLLYKYGELCVCDISDIVARSMSLVSQHLNKMRALQLVFSNRIGRTIYYSLNEEVLDMLIPVFIQMKKISI